MKKSKSHNGIVSHVDQSAFKISEINFRSVIENIQLIGVMLDKNANIIFANDFFLEITGWKRAEILGKNWFEYFIPKESISEIKVIFDETIKTGSFPNHHVNNIITKEGILHTIKWSNTTHINQRNNYISITSIGEDVTERNNAEIALKQSENKFRTLVTSMNDLAFVFNKEMRFIYYHTPKSELLYINPDMIIGKLVSDIMPLHVTNLFENAFMVVEKGEIISFDYNLEIQGIISWYSVILSPIFENNVFSGALAVARNITQHKQVEENLKESEERYKGIFDQAAVGVARVGLDGTWLEVNHKLCEIIGYTFKELSTKTFQDITHPDDLEADLSYVKQLLNHEIKTYSMEKRYFKKNGEIIWINLTASLVEDKENNPNYFISIIEDINKQKLVSLEKDSLVKFPSENPNPVLRISNNGIVLYANNAARNVLKSWETDLKKSVPLRWREILKKALSSEKTLVVKENVFDDIFLFSIKPVKNEHYINLYATDITEQHQAEESLAKFKTAIEKVEATILSTDTNGNIEYANPFFTELTDYSPEEYMGKNINFLKTDHHPRDFYKEMWATIKSGETWEGEFYNHKKNGDIYCEKAIITPIQNEDKIITNFVAIKTDITEDKKIEEQSRQSQKMEAIGQLAGGVAHDFNNMLTGIMGCAEIISSKVADDEVLSQFSNLIMDTSMQAAELTKKLLSFSHKAKSVDEIFDVHESITKVYSMLERSINKSISIKSMLNADQSIINGDKSLIQNVFLNLGINARDAMPSGGELTYTTKNLDISDTGSSPNINLLPGRYIEIDVEDSGCGITKEIQSRIFEPFFTTKNMGKGTGLGLSIVYNTIKENKGIITLYSEIDHGSIFKIFLPVVNDSPKTKEDKKK